MNGEGSTTLTLGNSQILKTKWMINPNDSCMLLIDHQSGLFQLVKDMEVPVLRNNVIALAKVARLAKIPTFTTASVPDGPNGPLIPEIHQVNPDAVYIPRSGQINAWDNPEYVKAIKQTGRKTLIMAGTLTSVCMAFPAVSAIEDGFKVCCVIDASGNYSKMATEICTARVAQAGAYPLDTFAVLSEIMATWNRSDSWQFAEVMMDNVVPLYRNLVECYKRDSGESKQPPQDQAKEGKMQQGASLGKLSAGIAIKQT